jgi:hypothetical protein
MAHELFIDVTAEQQEVVAGGVSSLLFATMYASLLQQSEVILPASGTSGASASSLLAGGIQKSMLATVQTGTMYTAVVS